MHRKIYLQRESCKDETCMKYYCSNSIMKIHVINYPYFVLSTLLSSSHIPEAATGSFLWKKVFLKILQISQENTRCFPVKTAKLLRAPILQNICERLFPNLTNIETVHQVVRIIRNYINPLNAGVAFI